MFVKGVPGAAKHIGTTVYGTVVIASLSSRKLDVSILTTYFVLKYDWVIMVLGDDDNEGDDTKARELTWRKLWRHCQ